MDKVKEIFRTLKRLHFWILCPLVIIMGLVGWYLTIGKLKKEAKKNRSDIESQFTKVQSLANEPIHPNDDVSNGMEMLTSERRAEVAAAWQEKWDQQTREGGVLTWPNFDWTADRKQEFMNAVRDKRPIEKEVPFPLDRGDEIRIGLRRAYRDYIQDELPKLAQMIGAVWQPTAAGGRGNRTSSRESASDDDAIVAWSGSNQGEIQEEHFNWERQGSSRGGGVARSEDAPSTLELLYAQEDLWVFRAVMQVIQRTNANATARFNAVVKEIEWLRIGSQAVRSDGHITRVAADDSGGEMGGRGDPMMRDGGEGMGGYEMGQRGGDPMGMGGEVSIDPGEGRYVDKDYMKLEHGKLRTVMQNTEEVSPEDAYLVVAKRIPVRMRLKVDQRKFHKLLVECANSELTIEVREIRVNPSKHAGGGGVYTRRAPTRGTDANAAAAAEATFSYEVTVEIYGIVYIYNPVDRSILGDGEAAEDDVAIGLRRLDRFREFSSTALNDRRSWWETKIYSQSENRILGLI